jgi:phage gp45-like
VFTREELRQFVHMLNPLKTRIANLVARGVVQTIDDSKKLQLLQLGLLEGEDADECENFQGYGFKSVPLDGAEAVSVFPDGDRGVPLVVGTEDRRHRPTGWEPGEAGIYNDQNLIVRLKDDGTIEAGVIGGPFHALALKSDIDDTNAHIDSHTHAGALGGTGSAPALTSPPSTNPLGTPLDPAPTAVGSATFKVD